MTDTNMARADRYDELEALWKKLDADPAWDDRLDEPDFDWHDNHMLVQGPGARVLVRVDCTDADYVISLDSERTQTTGSIAEVEHIIRATLQTSRRL